MRKIKEKIVITISDIGRLVVDNQGTVGLIITRYASGMFLINNKYYFPNGDVLFLEGDIERTYITDFVEELEK